MPHFIAERGEHSWIVFLVIGAIWVISSIIGTINKAQEKAKREQVRRSLEQRVPPQTSQRPPEMFQPQVSRRTPAKPQSGLRQAQSGGGRAVQQARSQPQRAPQRVPMARETKRSAARTAPPPIPARQAPPVVQAAPGALQPSKPDISATEIRSNASGKQAQGRVNAESLHGWLRPATLRQQFMLTEVLQPPLALREQNRA